MQRPMVSVKLRPEAAGRAKQLARQQGVSVSEMVNQLIESTPSPARSARMGPLTRAATGLFQLPEGKTVEELLEEVKTERLERHLR